MLETTVASGTAHISINEAPVELQLKDGRAPLDIAPDGRGQLLLIDGTSQGHQLYHVAQKKNGTLRIRHIPLWLSILPPLIAILLALIFKEVVISLFAGVWVGSFIAGGMRIESIYYFILSILDVVQKFVVNALTDSGHISVIVFSMLIGGMVAIISRNGGMAGVVKSLSRFARNRTSSQFVTWLLGVAIFFDDYANTLIVGNTMRSVTDRFRVSREKLAYLVDSTAAPVAAVAFITTWIGAELGYIDDGIKQLSGLDQGMTPYSVFISSLKYSYYPAFTLLFMLMVIYTRREFGPMVEAERRALEDGHINSVQQSNAHAETAEDLNPVEGAPLRWYNAAIPVGVVILMTIIGLLSTGFTSTYDSLVEAGIPVGGRSWGDIWSVMGGLLEGDNPGFFRKLGKLIGSSDSYVGLLWASLSGVITAVVLTLGSKIMSLAHTMSTMVTGFKTMLPALIILTMAWSLASTTESLHTATFLTGALRDSLNPFVVPALVFVLAAVISFSTGSSWSTMAILYPIAIPTVWAICQSKGLDHDMSLELLFNVIATVLAASVLGDHCSPISDTTILSSLASDCNHIDHVRTQMPYALTVGGVSIVAGTLATFLGGSVLVCFALLVLGLAVLWLILRRFGTVVG